MSTSAPGARTAIARASAKPCPARIIAAMREQWLQAQEYFRSTCRRGSHEKFTATKEMIDFKMGKKGALKPDFTRLRTDWKDDFAILLVIDKLDPEIPLLVPPVSAEMPTKKSKKKPSGNGVGGKTA